jgi:glycosyltransferase involved in cell wall biosynthesis
MLPSAVEGFGNVLVEAAAKSIPVVVSSRALGVADACIPDVTAKLVTGDSPGDFADGLLFAGEMVLPDLKHWLDRFTNASAAVNFDRLLAALQDS